MTVSELIEFLLKQDQDKEVTVWNREWECNDSIDSIELDEKSGELVIY